MYEWAGDMPVVKKLRDIFYKKVLPDELLEPVFKHMSPRHQLHVAHFIAELFLRTGALQYRGYRVTSK